MKKLLALALSAALALGALSGCGAKQAEIALVTDTGSIDDGSFNQGAWEGVVTYSEEKAISRQSFQPSEQSTEAYVQSIDRAVERGAKVVVCPGYLFADAVAQAAQAHTDVAFIAVDCQLPDAAPANAVGLVYARGTGRLFGRLCRGEGGNDQPGIFGRRGLGLGCALRLRLCAGGRVCGRPDGPCGRRRAGALRLYRQL